MEIRKHVDTLLLLCVFFVVMINYLAIAQEEESDYLSLDARLSGSEVAVQVTIRRNASDEQVMDTVRKWSEENDPERRPRNIAIFYDAIRNLRDGIISTKHWIITTGSYDAFVEFLLPLAAKARQSSSPLQVLEVGSYEGASAMWIAENMLEHPESRLLCVDIWSPLIPTGEGDDMHEIREHFLHNLEIRGKGKVEAWQGDSLHALSALIVDNKRYDFIYIDGSHEMADAAADALIAFRLLKPGGLMIFDDYGLGTPYYEQARRGIDILIDGLSDHLTILQRGYILVIQKTKDTFSVVPRQLSLVNQTEQSLANT